MKRVITVLLAGSFLSVGMAKADSFSVSLGLTISGVVEKVEYISPAPSACCEYMRITIRTAPGRIMYAWISPRWSSSVIVRIGDQVELRGVSVQWGIPGIVVNYVNNITRRKIYTFREKNRHGHWRRHSVYY